ncbi:MAG: hypothetical protein WC285_01170 [Candidatus Gracilibacteria bacterium]
MKKLNFRRAFIYLVATVFAVIMIIGSTSAVAPAQSPDAAGYVSPTFNNLNVQGNSTISGILTVIGTLNAGALNAPYLFNTYQIYPYGIGALPINILGDVIIGIAAGSTKNLTVTGNLTVNGTCNGGACGGAAAGVSSITAGTGINVSSATGAVIVSAKPLTYDSSVTVSAPSWTSVSPLEQPYTFRSAASSSISCPVGTVAVGCRLVPHAGISSANNNTDPESTTCKREMGNVNNAYCYSLWLFPVDMTITGDTDCKVSAMYSSDSPTNSNTGVFWTQYFKAAADCVKIN